MSVEILPLLGSVADVEFPRIRCGDPDKDYAHVGEHLAVVFVSYDNEAGQMYRQGVHSFESDPLDVAAAMLRAHRPAEFLAVADGAYSARAGDGLDSSRLLLVDEILALGLVGDPVAVVPHRDALYITGSEDPEGMRLLLEEAKSAFQVERPTSARFVRLRNRRWETWDLPREHPLHSDYQMLCYRELHGLYQAQRDLLMEAFGRKGDEIYVTPFDVFQDPDGGLVSYCTWTGAVTPDGISSALLLPVTDKIRIVRVEGQQPEPLVGFTDFEKVRRVCGPLLESTSYLPARLRSLAFPTGEMIRELASISPP
jgi:hypothetical protein